MVNTTLYFLIALMVSTFICFVVLTFFVVKLLISATKLTDSANLIASSVQKEVEPTLKELKEAAKSINSIANGADEKFKATKASLATLIGTTSCFGSKIKSFSQGILKGVAFGLKMFRK